MKNLFFIFFIFLPSIFYCESKFLQKESNLNKELLNICFFEEENIYLSFDRKFLKEKNMMKERKDIAFENKWDLEKMYSSLQKWHQELDAIKEGKLEEIIKYKDSLKDSSNNLEKTLTAYFSFGRKLDNLYTYAHLILDENLVESKAKEAFGLISNILFSFKEKTSWLEPEILQIPEDKFSKYIDDEKLKNFKFYLKKLFRLKPYTLSVHSEEILARVSKTFQTPYKTFSSFNNADISFEKVEDSFGVKHDLTHGKYLLFLRSKDRKLRKEAFNELHSKFLKFQNTLCELVQGQVENHVFISKTRNFKSSLEAALLPNKINVDVYKNLIRTVRENISILHKYVKLKKNLLGLEEIHPFDLYAPIGKEEDFSMTIEVAKEKVIQSVEILGKEYQNILRNGLLDNRWVDFMETKGKRSGAYSSGCYDSMPYILMNFHGSLNDVLTLAHEAGHSMHSYLSNQNQPYHYSQYPIFVAEIASTFNEQLFFDFLLKNATNLNQRKQLLSKQIDAIHATFFRQVLFAEFELKIHELVENNIPLTPKILKEIYGELYSFYYGKELALDENVKIEWARVPHFYYNFYVYQYATGISAAISLFNLAKKDKKHCQEYLKFLKSGGSVYPLEMLKKTGVDLTKKEPIESLILYFNSLMDSLSKC